MEDKKKTNNNSTKKDNKTTSSKKQSTSTTKKTNTSKKTTSTKKSTGTSKKTTNSKKSVVAPKEEAKKVETKKKEVKTITKEEVKDNSIKNEKKINKEINKSVKMVDTASDGTDEIRKLLIIIGAVCAVMLAFYFITEVVVKNKDKNSTDDNQGGIKIEADIQYEKILMGSLFEQNESDYYVYVYDKEDVMTEIYSQYISSYNNLSSYLKVYKVDLSEDYNKSYIATESYLSGGNITDIKVTGTTLIRIKDKQISSSYVGSEEIIKKLKELVG